MGLISLSKVTLGYGGRVLLDAADLSVERGDRMSLIGRNGCGKTTLLKIMAGILRPDSGLVERAKNLSAAYLPQEVPTGLRGSVYAVIAGGLGEAGRLAALRRGGGSDGEEPGEGLSEAWAADAKILETADRLELDPSLDVSEASAGLKRRALLGAGLVSNPDLLLLDEPTNHLDIDSAVWLEKFLKNCGKTAVFVSHDRSFLRGLSTRVAEVDRGKLIAFDCGFDKFVLLRDGLLAAREREEAEFDKKLAREEAWLRRGVKARRTRNEGRVRELMRLREIRASRVSRAGLAEIGAQEFSGSGQKVLEVKNLTVSYGGSPVVKNFSATVYRGDKIGIIGRNGAGKTTLLNAMLGRIAPDSGEVSEGAGVKVAYFDQLRAGLDPASTPFDFVGGGSEYVEVNGKRRHVAGYLQSFLFDPARMTTQIGSLSGGEKNRLMLAKIFSSPANLLVFDEPTNDLDIETIEILESALVSFPGTILIVSHDRDFLNNIVSGAFCFGEGGEIVEIVGGYDEWEKFRARRVAEAGKPPSLKPSAVPAQPKRRSKLSNREREELENIPGLIERLEAEAAEISGNLADPGFVIANASNIAGINARLAEIRAEDERLMARWEELETLRAELGKK